MRTTFQNVDNNINGPEQVFNDISIKITYKWLTSDETTVTLKQLAISEQPLNRVKSKKKCNFASQKIDTNKLMV